MSNVRGQKKQQTSERWTGLLVGAVFVIGVLYVASSYVRFHQDEHGELRYGHGRADICKDIEAKHPGMHKLLVGDKIC